jgi:hypothetical protein
MTRASEWVEEMFTEWVCKIEDERQLESWGRLIDSRLLRAEKRATALVGRDQGWASQL